MFVKQLFSEERCKIMKNCLIGNLRISKVINLKTEEALEVRNFVVALQGRTEIFH